MGSSDDKELLLVRVRGDGLPQGSSGVADGVAHDHHRQHDALHLQWVGP
jgi:hypothetical protein